MEVCGGQTHAIVKFCIDELLPENIELVHGPGCPVCVTPLELIDKAINIAERPNVIFTSFGDMLRVPGSEKDLLMVKAAGGDVRIVYSPLDAVRIARDNPDKEVVFFAVGFETTAPANAMAVRQAKELGVTNFSILVSHVLVPPAIEAVLSSPQCRVQGFLAAGHVCTVMGYEEYVPLAEKYKVPIVVTGFEPVDILQGVYMCVRQLEEGRARVAAHGGIAEQFVHCRGGQFARCLFLHHPAAVCRHLQKGRRARAGHYLPVFRPGRQYSGAVLYRRRPRGRFCDCQCCAGAFLWHRHRHDHGGNFPAR